MYPSPGLTWRGCGLVGVVPRGLGRLVARALAQALGAGGPGRGDGRGGEVRQAAPRVPAPRQVAHGLGRAQDGAARRALGGPRPALLRRGRPLAAGAPRLGQLVQPGHGVGPVRSITRASASSRPGGRGAVAVPRGGDRGDEVRLPAGDAAPGRHAARRQAVRGRRTIVLLGSCTTNKRRQNDLLTISPFLRIRMPHISKWIFKIKRGGAPLHGRKVLSWRSPSHVILKFSTFIHSKKKFFLIEKKKKEK